MSEAMTAMRHNKGKPELRFIFTFPEAIRAIARVCMYGSRKYALYNYLRGAPASQYADCMMRHFTAWWNGEDADPESGLNHLDHFVWNACCLVQMMFSHGGAERDDRPHLVMRRQEEADDVADAQKKIREYEAHAGFERGGVQREKTLKSGPTPGGWEWVEKVYPPRPLYSEPSTFHGHEGPDGMWVSCDRKECLR